jgi:hypothetical protein
MRNLAFALSGLVLTTLASAQVCSLGQPLTSPNQGNPGGGLYFNLTINTTVTFNSVTYVASEVSATGSSSFNMFVGPATWVNNVGANPGPWTLIGATTPVPITTGVDTVCVGVLNPAGANPGTVTFGPGTYGVALQAVGHSWGYQNGAFTFNAPNNDFSVATGGASNAFLTLPTFSPRSINGSIAYTLGGTVMPFARRTPYGAGCYRFFRSIYELFPSSVFVDFNNTSMLWTIDTTNNRWSLISAGTTAVNTAAVTSPSLGHTDDSNLIINILPSGQPILFPNIGGLGVATNTVEMCSNGYVNLLGTAAALPNPTPVDWLTGAAVRIGNHHDMDPSVGGTTHYDYDVANAAHLFTWLNVPDFGIAGSSNTFQMAFFANGNMEMRWGLMSMLGGGGWPTLVGFSPGGTSLDPGNIDLSASLPTFTSPIDQAPLRLDAATNPVLGTTVNLTTGNVTGINLGVCFISLSDLPGFSPAGLDLGIIGAPGCVANVDLNLSVGSIISNLGAPFPGLTVAFPIPAGPVSLVGQSFFCQSAWLDATQNAAGILTSNAVELKLGQF